MQQLAGGVLFQLPQQVALINAGEALLHAIGAGLQHQRRRDHHRRLQQAVGALLCQIAGQHVAAERNAYCRGWHLAVAVAQPAQEEACIFGFTGVVDALLAVGHAAAAAKVHHHAEPATLTPGVEQAMRVGAVEAAFQAVEQHRARFVARLRRIFAPGEIDEIAVGQFQPLPMRFQ
ncbi:hypothetical protein AN414_11465 [Serratia marcescens]|nr:hypothetical protein AN414_11465 [Serratia marcescens]